MTPVPDRLVHRIRPSGATSEIASGAPERIARSSSSPGWKSVTRAAYRNDGGVGSAGRARSSLRDYAMDCVPRALRPLISRVYGLARRVQAARLGRFVGATERGTLMLQSDYNPYAPPSLDADRPLGQHRDDEEVLLVADRTPRLVARIIDQVLWLAPAIAAGNIYSSTAS